MSLAKTIGRIILEALFPVKEAEKIVDELSSSEALKRLARASPPPLSNAYSVFAYKDQRVTALVWNLKYKRSQKAARLAAYALNEKLKEVVARERSSLKYPVLMIPMAMTARRLRERGFNQCALIADELKKLDDADKTVQIEIASDLLERIVHASRQTLKDREERLESAKGVFSVNRKVLLKFSAAELENRLAVVIDDVITTGSTMKEAMATMEKAGFKKVRGLSVAH